MRIYREIPEDNISAEDLPPGTRIKDADGDEFVKDVNSQWFYVYSGEGRNTEQIEEWVTNPIRILTGGN